MSKKTENALKLLIVDDSVEDAEAIVSGLRNAGIAVRPSRAADAEELAQALSAAPDLVLAALSARALPFADTVQRVLASGKDLPVIAVADRFDEIAYNDAIGAGARAVALRSRAQQLLSLIRNEWDNLEARRARRRLEARLRETERRCDALIESSRDPIAYIHEGMHIRANAAYLEMFGYDDFEDVEGMSILDMVGPQHVEEFKQLLKALAKGEPPPARHELEVRDIEGNAFPASMEFTQAQYEGEPCLQVVFRRHELDSELVLELEELRQRDQVTGLLNRPTFLRALEDAVDDAAQNHGQYGLLLIEPDHYQRLLQDMGLDSADAMLAALAARLRGVLGADATAARFSEHTLAVLLHDSDYAGTVALAERVRDAFSAEVVPAGDRSSAITASIGGVQIGEKIANVSQVLSRAAQGVESAIGVGGNRYEIFDPAATDRAEEEHVRAWVGRLRDALDHHKVLLHFQPVINLHGESGAVYESLLRLDGGDGELVLPSSFMQIAAENGLLAEIDRAVLAKAIALAAERIQSRRPTTLLVKLSQAALEDKQLADYIGELLRASGVPGEYIVVQLPEAKVFTHLRAAQEFAQQLSRHDCRFALEQFGAGLDSFQLLAHLKPNMLKIDRSFIEDLPRNPDSQERIVEITRRARELGIRTIAEFVQDAASMSILFSAGVDYAQGNFLAPAGPGMHYDFD